MTYPPELTHVILDGNYAVIPTDTIYGIVGSALQEKVVEELYAVRKRDTAKPFIVLIADTKQLELFDIPSEQYAHILQRYWPGPFSIILPCLSERFTYLHRGTKAIAFRLPALLELQELIHATGPIVAPSANPEHLPPASTINEAKHYFGDAVSLYVDGGEVHGTPSTLLSIGENGSIEKLR